MAAKVAKAKMPISAIEPGPKAGKARGEDDREGGFTLVEMLLVVVLLALAAGLVMARANPDRSAQGLQAQLADYLRKARAAAILDGRVVTLALDPRSGRLVGPPPLGRLQLDARLTLETAAPDGRVLAFQPDGSTAGGVLRIAPPGRGGAAQGVAVAPLTGAITALP